MTKQTAVIGFPIKHSVSPQIHNYWITKYNLNINKYKKIPVVPKNLSVFLNQCKEEQYRGLNITIPHKELHKRMFVLKPLMDICPQWNHPILDVNIKKIISSSESSEKIRIYRNIL